MARNRRAITHPDSVVPLYMVEQPLERANSTGASDDASVQADAHHPGAPFATASVEPVEGVRAVTEKVFARGDVAATLHAAVVAIEGVWNDELIAVANPYPVRQVIIVRIAVVQETSLFGDEPARVGTRTTGVPTNGPLANEPGYNIDIAGDVGPFDIFRNQLVVDPAVTVTCDLKATVLDLGDRRRVALQRHTDCIDSRRYQPMAQNPRDFPETHATAVFEIRLDIEVACIRQWLTAYVGQDIFGVRIAVQNVVFATLFVVQNDGDGDAGVVGPPWIGWGTGVSGQVPWVAHEWDSCAIQSM
jgi:hypothetical protein